MKISFTGINIGFGDSLVDKVLEGIVTAVLGGAALYFLGGTAVAGIGQWVSKETNYYNIGDRPLKVERQSPPISFLRYTLVTGKNGRTTYATSDDTGREVVIMDTDNDGRFVFGRDVVKMGKHDVNKQEFKRWTEYVSSEEVRNALAGN